MRAGLVINGNRRWIRRGRTEKFIGRYDNCVYVNALLMVDTCLGTRALPIAANWAVGSFAAASIATYEFCQRRRRKELDGMKQAVDLMKEVKLKKQREKEKAAEEAARQAEEEKKRKSWTNLSNYKFW